MGIGGWNELLFKNPYQRTFARFDSVADSTGAKDIKGDRFESKTGPIGQAGARRG